MTDPAIVHSVVPALEHLLTPLEAVTPHPRNARNGDLEAILESLRTSGQYAPVVAQQSTGLIIKGNHVYASMLADGWTHGAVTYLDVDDEEAVRILLRDNRLSDLGQYDDAGLYDLMRWLAEETDAGLEGTAYDLEYLERLGQIVDHQVADDLDLSGALEQTRGLGTPVISYAIVFDNGEQQTAWFDLMRWMRKAYDAETLGARVQTLVADLERRGIITDTPED